MPRRGEAVFLRIHLADHVVAVGVHYARRATGHRAPMLHWQPRQTAAMPAHVETADGSQGDGRHKGWRGATEETSILLPAVFGVNRKEMDNLCVMRINVDFPDLQALCVLAHCGSFTEAAQVLALTPSALSRRIAKVEDAIGGRLVERTTRSMGLTSLGQRLVERMAPLLEMVDGCLVDASDVAAGRQGRLSVGCIATLAQSVFPLALQHFHARYPEVRISLRDSHGAQVRRAVLEREVEFGLTPLWESNEELVAEPVAQDAYRAVCAADHPLADRKTLQWRELARWKVLSFNPGSATRQQIDGVLRAEGISLPWFDEVDSLSTLMGHVERGDVVTVLPALAMAAGAHLASLALEGPRIERTVYLIRRRDVTLGSPAQFLWDALREALHAR